MNKGRYALPFALSMIAYMAVLFISIWLIRSHPGLPTWLAATLGLSPMIPLLFTLRTSVQSFRALDEMERRIQSEALMLSVAATAVVSLSYGFLQISVDAPAVSWIWVWPVLATFWGLGKCVAQRRYQ